jgi:hypothetical protein
MEHEAHNPALLHHFADAQQQKNAASLGMWLFLVTEIMFFGGMFCAYLIYRLAHFNAFAAGSQQLNIWMGAINTAVLIVSSVTVVLAVKAAEAGKRKLLVGYLVVTVLLGLTFLVVKGFEYKEKFEKHHVPGSTFSFTDKFDDNGKQIPVNPEGSRTVFLALFRDDRHARAAHDHRLRTVWHSGGAWPGRDITRPNLLYAHRKRGPVLALGRYHLDLSVSVVVSDQQAS